MVVGRGRDREMEKQRKTEGKERERESDNREREVKQETVISMGRHKCIIHGFNFAELDPHHMNVLYKSIWIQFLWI